MAFLSRYILYVLLLFPLSAIGQKAQKGFVYMLRGQNDKAKAWFDAIMEHNNMDTWTLYGESLLYADSLQTYHNMFTALQYAHDAQRYSFMAINQSIEVKQQHIYLADITKHYHTLEKKIVHKILSSNDTVLYQQFIQQCSFSDYTDSIKNVYKRYAMPLPMPTIIVQEVKKAFIRGSSELFDSAQLERLQTWRHETEILYNTYPQVIQCTLPDTTRLDVALTFDDGPDDVITPQILAILQQAGIKATFFCVGENIKKYPDVAQKIVHDGHTLLNHSNNHLRFVEISESEVQHQILQTEVHLKKAQLPVLKYLRPPYGHINNRVVQIADSLNYKLILWSLDACDWVRDETDAQRIIRNVCSNVAKGDIILMHTKPVTVEALPDIIYYLQQQQYNFVNLPVHK